jgi:hypothetical protein
VLPNQPPEGYVKFYPVESQPSGGEFIEVMPIQPPEGYVKLYPD